MEIKNKLEELRSKRICSSENKTVEPCREEEIVAEYVDSEDESEKPEADWKENCLLYDFHPFIRAAHTTIIPMTCQIR